MSLFESLSVRWVALRSALARLVRRPERLVSLHSLVWLLAALPLALLLYAVALVPFTPGIGDIRKAKTEQPAQLMSADGKLLAEYRWANREWVALDQISPNVVNALIATEDHRFYDHFGLDWRRTASSVLLTLRGDPQGGSTITQQLARNLYPEEIGRSATVSRKVKEAITAIKIEAVYSKAEILETYLNTVPFLYNAFGIEMAAQTYFDKSAEKLDVLESATLIGMLKGTSYYNPVQNPKRSLQRRNLVLAQMVKTGKLDAVRVDALTKRPLRLNFERQGELQGPAPHLAQHLKKWLISWADSRGLNIYADGLRIRSTLDAGMQKAANQAVTRQLAQLQRLADRERKAGKEPAVLQAGFLAMDPRNGAVRAWVGSRDFALEQFDHVSQARRQPGSTFQPFVYGAAFLQGSSPNDTLIDQPVAIKTPGGGVWTPSDATPPTYQPFTLRDGLAYSKNTITAQLMQQVGPAQVARLAQAAGVRQSPLDVVPSLALGTSPVTLIEMVTAYGTIANGGQYMPPLTVAQVEDRSGQVLEAFAAVREKDLAMPRAESLTLVDAMRGVIDRGTGAAIRQRYGLQADLAGKTGTTQDNTDGWFIMMHPQLVAGARVGFNDNNAAMGSWGEGARSALPVVGDVFQQALRQRWIDPNLEFDIERSRPTPAPEPSQQQSPQQQQNAPLNQIINGLFGRILGQLR